MNKMKMNLASIVAQNRADILTRKDKVNVALIDTKINSIKDSDLWDIKWVWEATIKILSENWIRTQEDLRNADLVLIKRIITNFLSYRAIEKFLSQ